MIFFRFLDLYVYCVFFFYSSFLSNCVFRKILASIAVVWLAICDLERDFRIAKEFRIEWSHLVSSIRDECGSPLIFISQKRRWRKWDRALGFPGNSTKR